MRHVDLRQFQACRHFVWVFIILGIHVPNNMTEKVAGSKCIQQFGVTIYVISLCFMDVVKLDMLLPVYQVSIVLVSVDGYCKSVNATVRNCI